MKKALLLLFVILSVTGFRQAFAQVQELEQLALDIEKLAQFKSILSDMYKGYQILSKGYETIRSISEGNFNLHQAFLSGLLSVSPAVKKYERIADIITNQQTLVKEYKTALSNFSGSKVFSVSEMSYISGVYANLIDKSVDNLNELLMVITDNQLRMNDAERLSAIDNINSDMVDKISFLRSFNNNTSILASQRQKDLQENSFLKNIYGIQK